MIAALAWLGTVIADRQRLSNNLIRLHVVAASDSQEDQAAKLLVRDAVLNELNGAMENCPDADTAKAYLTQRLPILQEAASAALDEAGINEPVAVSLTREKFSARQYDTFSLPAGVYDSLRITIGDGEGKNWWCVVFPSLCISATTEGFSDTAAGAGFPDSLSAALQHNGGYEVRFFFLDCLGWLENLFYNA